MLKSEQLTIRDKWLQRPNNNVLVEPSYNVQFKSEQDTSRDKWLDRPNNNVLIRTSYYVLVRTSYNVLVKKIDYSGHVTM